jgi:hypothetical protein
MCLWSRRSWTDGFHYGQGALTPPKAEYIGADHNVSLSFRLQLSGRPYIPIFTDIAQFLRLKGRLGRVIAGPKGVSRDESGIIISAA